MRNLERPGVNQKWLKSWKAVCSNLTEWRDGLGPTTIQELEYYIQHGYMEAALESDKKYPPPPGINPPVKKWESYVNSSLNIYGLMRVFELEVKGMAGMPFDTALAERAFYAIYIYEMIGLHSLYMGRFRFGRGGYTNLEYLPFTALGVVIGCKEQAFRLARVQIAAYNKTTEGEFWEDANYPIFHFILRVLADYLNESPIIMRGEAKKEPILNALFEHWRDPDADSLVNLCLAACDFHTHRCGNKTEHEFGDHWVRTPIEILLLFKLRQLLGLSNPQLDHPLMNTPLGKLPEKEVTCEPDDLIRRVRERMMQDGYDEEEIAGYYRGPVTTHRPSVPVATTDTPAPVAAPHVFKAPRTTPGQAPAKLVVTPDQAALAMVAELLETAALEFADHSCNDFLLPATEENKAIFAAVLEHHDDNAPDDEHELSAEEIMAATDEVFVYDHWAMAYFAERCAALVQDPSASAILSPSELFAISALLDYACEDHERVSGDVCFDLTYPATEENKAIIAATISLFAAEMEDYSAPDRRKLARTVQEISKALQESDEIDIPDFWLMHYLARKCRKLSGISARAD